MFVKCLTGLRGAGAASGGCVALEQLRGDTPRPSQRNPSKTVGAGAAMRRYLTSKGKGEKPQQDGANYV